MLQIHHAVKSLIKDIGKVTTVKVLPFLSEKVSLRTLQKRMKADKDLGYKNVPKRICLTGSQKLK